MVRAGIPALMLLSKIDECDPDALVGDLTKTFHSVKVHNAVQVYAL